MLTGNVDIISLADLLQVSAANRRTLRVELFTGTVAGWLMIEAGEVVDAELGELAGADAVYAALAAREVRYHVVAGAESRRRTITGSTPHLLLEAARLVDEGSVPHLRPRTAVTFPPPVPEAMPPTPRRWRRPITIGAGMALAVVLGVSAAALWSTRSTPRTTAAPPAAAAATASPGEPAALASAAATAVEAASLTGPDDVAPRLVVGPPARRPVVDVALTPTIVVRLLVGADGQVVNAKVYRSRADLVAFEDAALDAAARYRFEPARKAGHPIAVWINVPVGFVDRAAPVRHLSMKGSDTIGGHLGPALAAAFQDDHPDVDITVEALGSSTAFAGLFDGSADLGASSRPVKAGELAEAGRLGLRLEEFVIGYDGLAIIVHDANPVRTLTIDQASRLFTGAAPRWAEVGGDDAAVHLLGRPSYSGTQSFFKDKVVRRGGSDRKDDFALTTTVLESSEDIVARVADDPHAVAYVGLGYLRPGVRALAIAPGDGAAAVMPSAATVRDGSYPVYRPLLIYTRGAPRGTVAGFLRFVLSATGQALVEASGFVPSEIMADALIPPEAEASEAPTTALVGPVARVEFAAGSAALGDDVRRSLSALARDAVERDVVVRVVGNADAEGSAAEIQRLSRTRAEIVAGHLGRAGVPRRNLIVEVAGADRPLATNMTRDGRAHNRRVDVYLVER